MSSSVFAETSITASDSLLNGDGSAGKADSNLVVVYGKNGINVDRKGLENLIDEKTLTSISVIRITSPTPSMHEEEAEEKRKEDEKNAGDDDKSPASDDEEDERENSDSEDESKTTKTIKAPAKERPEIVGLTVEEFYPPEAAKELAKEILKYAGVTPLKCNVDYEFQRYVIKNDHCYTPFTSPSQMVKAKSTLEDDDKQPIPSVRKQSAAGATVKQYLNKRKLLIDEKQRKQSEKEKSGVADADENVADDERLDDDAEDDGDEDLDDDDSDYTEESVQSAESDNDRDSDLDFDVNNRHGRKRKTALSRRKKKEKQRARSVMMQKAASSKRRQQSQDNSTNEEDKTLLTPVKMNRQLLDSRKSISVFTTVKGIAKKQATESLDAVVTGQCLPPPSSHSKQLINIQSVQVIQPAKSILPVHPVVVDRPAQVVAKPLQLKPAAPPSTVPQSPQTVKQIVINKVIASPKGGFTDLSTLLARSENLQTETKPEKPPTPSTTKGFMPLGVDAASKSQLPAQISIQTHQSSSELAAENDKQQLDLIDSIFKDELEKTYKAGEKSSLKENSIPDLVKMLENTEKAVLEQNKLASTFTSSSVEAIDIANAPLLETADDEIPDDLLEHVAELMEDKSLQEVVEKEILQQQQKQQQQSKSVLVQQPQQIILPVRQLPLISTPVTKQPKSIIEASISNTTTPSTSRDTTPTPSSNRPANLQTYGRKEPIQIVRGNGRVITLPPIEAPTTRAKRRAQAKPSVDTSFIDSESGDVSMHSDTSLFTDVSMTEKPEPVTPLPTPKPATKATPAAKKKASAKASKKAAAALNASEDHESQEEDEDDPNKLWCICRQPHNNRFMICCDVCEDWFHGTCVNITKAMGLEMEQKGVEWTCPKCVKKQEVKKQRKITDLFDKKTLVLPMPKLDDPPKPPTLVQSTITVTELPAQKRHLIDFKKLQPGRFYTLAKVDATKQAQQPDQPAVTAATVSAASPMPEPTITTSTPVQRKLTDFSIKKTPEGNVSAGGAAAKRVIVLPSNAKTLNRGMATVKSPAAQQQQPQIKFTKVPTAAEKKQFTLTKLQQQPQTKTVVAATVESEQLPVTVSNSNSQQQHKPPEQKKEPVEMLTCIVCKKTARANSIYCSDDCIRKHAQNALNNVSKNAVKSPEPVATPSPVKLGPDEKKKKSKGLFEDLLSLVDRKPKVERVYVFERRSGKILTGNNAPTTLNLKKWLQDNPTFEVVQPGSPQAAEIEKLKQKNRMSVQSPTNSHTFTPVRPDGPIVTSVITITPAKTHSPSPVLPKIAKAQEANKSITKPANSPTVNQPQRSLTPKQLLKHPHQVTPKPDKLDKDKDKPSSSSASSSKVLKKQVSTEKEAPPAQTPSRSDSSEPVRVNVRRTLKEQLLIRMNDLSDDNKLTPQQVEHFVKATELEMYRLFNKDIGTKYKAKYRSLMFNIKDRKNETLLQKICAKLIEPSQFVRMSPEELASQELAQWRENEAKHQLEMIKKSELDMLSCTKNYVLKTHKGEEVIEGKSTDRVELDISIPVEDVVAVLNNSTVSSTTEIDSSMVAPKKDASSDFDNSVHMAQDTAQPPAASSTSDKKKQSIKERDRDNREKRHKSKDRHKEKSRKRSRSRSREHKHKSSSRKDERRDREDRATKKDDHDSIAKTAKLVAPLKISLPPSTAVVPTKLPTPTKVAHKEQPIIKKSTKPPPIEQFNLIDQILESEKTVEEAANLTNEKSTPVIPLITTATENISTPKVDDSTATSSSSSAATKSKPQSPLGADSDQEPSSTVSISTPPEDPYYKYSSDVDATLWTGLIHMTDVASFQVSLQAVSGNTYLLSKMLPDELGVVGRISPDTVWDYIGKIKRSPNKEIVIVRLVPAVESENIAYTILYKYLDKRKRLGVIETKSPNIKDFYIMPLGVGQQMPSVLRPNENFDFYDDVMRPDMLLGIVIRIMGKRHSNAVQRRKKEATVISNRQSTLSLDGDSTNTFTPPGSPKSRADSSRSGQSGSSRAMRMPHKSTDDDEFDIDAIIKAPITSKNASKGQVPVAVAQKDDADEPYSPGGSSDDDVQGVPIRDDDLKRKMDEINRQIEAQKMEIAGLLGQEQSSYSSGSNALAPALANISIPSNLQQILASIQSKPDPPALSSSAPSMVPPPPMIGSLAMQSGNPDEEYTPELPIMRSHNAGVSNQQRTDSKPGRLAQLSEAELLSMVPDDIDIDKSNTSSHKNVGGGDQPPEKRPRWSDAPPPGMDVDY